MYGVYKKLKHCSKASRDSYCYESLSIFLNTDFYRVNRKALSNPRVSVSISLDCRLSSVIKRLESRFSPADNKMWLNCVALLPNAKDFTSGRTNLKDSELWVVPRPGTVLRKPTIATKEPMTSTTLSLSNLQSKLDPPNVDDIKEQVKIKLGDCLK